MKAIGLRAKFKLYKLEEAHPTTAAAALSNNHFDNRKDLTFHVSLKDPFLSTFQHTFIQHYTTASGISFGVNS